MHPASVVRGLRPNHTNTAGLVRPKTKFVANAPQTPNLIPPTLNHRVPQDIPAPRHETILPQPKPAHLLAEAPVFIPISQIESFPQRELTPPTSENSTRSTEESFLEDYQVEYSDYPHELQPLPYAYPIYPAQAIPAYGPVPFPQFAYPPNTIVPMYAYSAFPMTSYSYGNQAAMRKPAPRRSFQPFSSQNPNPPMMNPVQMNAPFFMAPPVDYYAYSAPLLDQNQFLLKENPAFLDPYVSAEDLYQNITTHLNNNEKCRVSWLNRLLSKVETQEEFEKALEVFTKYADRNADLTGETGTLLIKAACRANFAERILDMLCDPTKRLWPTIGGIHYLMINFSLKKDTHSVMRAFTAAKIRNLEPSARTFHIVIRECVDNNLTEDALKFAQQFKEYSIVPNRVTFNILMNGCRKLNRPDEILKLRDQMNELNIDINDTTVKFTSLAHMMKGNLSEAIKEFESYPGLDTKLEEFALKFLEVTEENDDSQNRCVAQLLRAIQSRGFILPQTLQVQLDQLEQNLTVTDLN
eukprot:TRINITY_DN1628_c0_g1_i1.p1 TRINITY_DN1628_c0_g1~~TRINITY_DN1628_c0_g1_i1.p1  ORF type:complete len:525 (+),score=104.30 TRINITY_DN1628_c0_g1_i1:119-1693(+)